MAQTKSVSVREIARISGFAASTVSRVLNKKNNIQIAKTTRERVSKIAKDLSYQPNIHAKRLFSRKSNVIGMVVPPFDKLFDENQCGGIRHVDTTLAETMNGAIEMARTHGYHIMTIVSDEEFIEKKDYLNLFRSQSVDGLLIWGICLDEDYILELVEDNFKFVLLNTHLRTGKFRRVFVNNYTSSVELCKKLLKLGHKRIGYICGRDGSTIGRERADGFIDTLKEVGLFDPNLVVMGDYYIESGKSGCIELLKRDPNITAISCANDVMAFGVLENLDGRGIKVPDEISVTGADASFSYFFPRLTSFRPPFYEVGQQAAELLIKSLNNSGETQDDNSEIEIVLEAMQYPGQSIGLARNTGKELL